MSGVIKMISEYVNILACTEQVLLIACFSMHRTLHQFVWMWIQSEVFFVNLLFDCTKMTDQKGYSKDNQKGFSRLNSYIA